MILMAAFIRQPGEGVETQLSRQPQQQCRHSSPSPFCFFKNMSASPWWLAVRMYCVFVLDLMPNLLSNNDCTGSDSDGKGKGMEEWALIPHCYSGTGSQQEPYEAAVWFWHFVNVVSETCQSPWFNMACCCSSSPGAYIKSVPAWGDVQYVCVHSLLILLCVEIHVCQSEINMCKQTIYTYIFHIIDTKAREQAYHKCSLSQNGAFTHVDWCLAGAQMEGEDTKLTSCICLSHFNEFSWGNRLST